MEGVEAVEVEKLYAFVRAFFGTHLFFRQVPTGDRNIFQSHQMENVVAKIIVSIKFFLHSETQKREVFQDDFLHENIPDIRFLLLNDCKSQIPRVKALKYCVFEMKFSSNR